MPLKIVDGDPGAVDPFGDPTAPEDAASGVETPVHEDGGMAPAGAALPETLSALRAVWTAAMAEAEPTDVVETKP